MSAYGPSTPRQTNGPLISTKFLTLKPSGTHNRSQLLSVHHLTGATIPSALAAILYNIFQDELERGATYPQEYPMTRSAFDVYFLGNDFFVGILHPDDFVPPSQETQIQFSVEEARNDRQWADCVAGAYYVKPNYPGRSSHICNAGFIVNPTFRRMGIATALAQTYVEHAPLLGYKASVFNLVYVNNVASVRIWDRLGFTKVGRIPAAGRLRKRPEDGEGEEFVDAWVVHKSFVSKGGASSD